MLKKTVSQYFISMQRNLFPGFAEDLGPTTDKHLRVIVALDMIEVEKFTLYQSPFAVGRPPVNRDAMARAFVAKAVLNISTTMGLHCLSQMSMPCKNFIKILSSCLKPWDIPILTPLRGHNSSLTEAMWLNFK